MRKPRVVLFALALGVALLLTAALPVAAAVPDGQPESWVTWEGNVTPKLYLANMGGSEGHICGNVMVKQMSDGSIVGRINTKDLMGHTKSSCTEFTYASFQDNTALVEGWFLETGFSVPIKERYTLVDNGEPGAGTDRINIELEVAPGFWVSFFNSPGPIPLVTHGNIQVHTAK